MSKLATDYIHIVPCPFSLSWVVDAKSLAPHLPSTCVFAFVIAFAGSGAARASKMDVKPRSIKAEPRPWPYGNAESNQSTLSDDYLSTSNNDCLFGLANFIAPMVVQFLGVRSLISFGATSKSQQTTMAHEVERRKARIADIEVEVTRLMASANQSTQLSDYINGSLKGFCEGGIQDGWPPEFEVGDLRLDENKEFEVSNLPYHNFVEAKILVYKAMRLIDDEIGIFHKTLVCDDEGTEYYNSGRMFNTPVCRVTLLSCRSATFQHLPKVPFRNPHCCASLVIKLDSSSRKDGSSFPMCNISGYGDPALC